MDIILATRNPSKAHQIQALFTGSDVRILTLAEAGIEGEAVENGMTLRENAVKKARHAYGAQGEPKRWTMADDTGLFIIGLGGAPGIHAARWAGENKTTEEIMAHCLRQMEPLQNRTAVFRTVAVLFSPDGTEHAFAGEVAGRMLETPAVPPQPKMPYSSLFVPDGSSKTWAEMTTEEENLLSHRGKAFALARAFLEKHR